MVFGFALLASCIIGGSFIGPISNLLESENSWVKVQWAWYLRLFYISPLLISEIITTKGYWTKIKSVMTWKIILGIFITPFLNIFHVYGLIYGSANLIQSHAYTLNTMFSIFIVLIGYSLCLRPYRLELLGLFITIGGCILLFNDTEAERVDGKKGEFHVYVICLLMSFMAALYFIFNGLLVKVVPIFTLLAL